MKTSIKTITAAALMATSVQFLTAGAAYATPDLQLSKFKVLGKAYQGNCTKVAISVKNIGDSASGPTYGAIVTFPQGNSFQDRQTKQIYLAPMRPGQSRTMTISKVSILPLGNVTLQAVVNTGKYKKPNDPSLGLVVPPFTESNTNNNFKTVNTKVHQACLQPGGSNKPVDGACDLKLTFTSPTGSTIAQDDSTEFNVLAKNEGSAECPKRNVRLYRYSGSSAGGFGSAVGGTSGSIRNIPALAPGQTESLEWAASPGGAGTFTYATKIMSAHNDANNNNHKPKKTVIAE